MILSSQNEASIRANFIIRNILQRARFELQINGLSTIRLRNIRVAVEGMTRRRMMKLKGEGKLNRISNFENERSGEA